MVTRFPKIVVQSLTILALASIGVTIALSPLGQFVDRYLYDSLIIHNHPQEPPEDIAIVAIDEASFAMLQQQWPWPRSWHARLIDALFASGAKTVVFDIVFAESSIPEEDQAFLLSLRGHPNVVLASSLEIVNQANYVTCINIEPLDSFSASAQAIGLDTMPLDPDGIIRRNFLNHHNHDALGFAAAWSHSDATTRKILQDLKAKQQTVPIQFHGPPGTIKTVSYYQALDPGQYLPQDCFKDKLVFVGLATSNVVDTASQPDHYPTPYVRFGYGYMAGIEIQANLAATCLDQHFIREISSPWLYTMTAILCLMVGFCSVRWSAGKSGLCYGLGVSVCIVMNILFFSHLSIYIPLAVVLIPAGFIYLTGVCLSYGQVIYEKKQIQSISSKYLSSPFVRHVLKHPETLGPKGISTEGSVMFLDIQNFTTLTQSESGDDLFKVLSRYLGVFSDIILEQQGHIDKIVGDGLMAIWGVLTPCSDHASLACQTALAIEKVVIEQRQKDANSLDIRIGINSGTLYAGNVSGRQFSDYTVHGIDVNLGARLEAANKVYGTRLIIGRQTRDQLDNTYVIRELDTVMISGYPQAVTLFELLGTIHGVDPTQQEFVQCFNLARKHFKQREWKTAKDLFQQALKLIPQDVSCLSHLQRCDQYQQTPPSIDWTGAYHLEEIQHH